MNCRFCALPIQDPVFSLGRSPLANAFLSPNGRTEAQEERVYPLDLYFCGRCFLLQLEAHETPENIFGEYAYFSSYSDTWLRHVDEYAEEMIKVLRLDGSRRVVEVASNDGHLLKSFQRKGVQVLGIEPARNVAGAANAQGVPTLPEFFGSRLARRLKEEGREADLLVANNVLAHVPDLNDFVEGLRILLKPTGVLTVEFPHLLPLVGKTEFDTIYHEHFSYFSLRTAEGVFLSHGLEVYDAEELPTHGGSLRLHVTHAADRGPSGRMRAIHRREDEAGLFSAATYEAFGRRAEALRDRIRSFLSERKREGKTIVGYGAPAKGNTLLNYCGIDRSWVDYTVDRNVYKQGRCLPGSRIPVEAPARIGRTRPDYVLILPWNLEREITEQMGFIRDWGGRFIVPIPDVRIV